eukprot:gb/GFBE01027624.1/.p1 GENE.gb/GFBE01027624.1/~~gb/GFBE01027624.1/.p1  ORF type:complete len:228 (+),score=17.09 gb/GFBE01027624.1/:1-684(+)
MGVSSSSKPFWRHAPKEVNSVPCSRADSFLHSMLTPCSTSVLDSIHEAAAQRPVKDHRSSSSIGMSASVIEHVLKPGETQVWEAVLWKRSQHLQVWRQRHLQLLDMGEGWQLVSRDRRGRRTGSWELERSMPYIEMAPHGRFHMAMEVAGIALAADSEAGAQAMERLAVILNGRLMRVAPRGERCCSFADLAMMSDKEDSPMHLGHRPRSHCQSPALRSKGVTPLRC